jgi:hypothetical protein
MYLAIVYMCGAMPLGPLSCSAAAVPALFPTEERCEAAAIQTNRRVYDNLSEALRSGLQEMGHRCIPIGGRL